VALNRGKKRVEGTLCFFLALGKPGYRLLCQDLSLHKSFDNRICSRL
jgi:hypothetical protein